MDRIGVAGAFRSISETLRRPHPESFESVAASSLVVRLPSGERHNVTSLPSPSRQRNERIVMTGERPTCEEQPGVHASAG